MVSYLLLSSTPRGHYNLGFFMALLKVMQKKQQQQKNSFIQVVVSNSLWSKFQIAWKTVLKKVRFSEFHVLDLCNSLKIAAFLVSFRYFLYIASTVHVCSFCVLDGSCQFSGFYLNSFGFAWNLNTLLLGNFDLSIVLGKGVLVIRIVSVLVLFEGPFNGNSHSSLNGGFGEYSEKVSV